MQPDWPYLQLSIHTSIDLQDKVPQPSTRFTLSFNICYDLTFMARQHNTKIEQNYWMNNPKNTNKGWTTHTPTDNKQNNTQNNNW